jgi:hypothetical protein
METVRQSAPALAVERTRLPNARTGHHVLLGGWFVLLSVVSASLLVRHLALPRPQNHELGLALAEFRPDRRTDDTGREELGLVHVLYAECRCSNLVVEHLCTKPRPAGVVEHVLLVGSDEPLAKKLGSHGFDVKRVSSEDLESLGIEAAPLFVVLSRTGDVRYAGGYTERKQGLLPRDREIVSALRAGRDAAPFPVFGCAVSDGLKRTLNPLRLP